MTLLRIAFRNVLKNWRRSLITMLAIGFGFMAVAMFKGYTHNAYEQITINAVFMEAPGHFVIFKKGFLENGKVRPERYLLSANEVQTIQNALRSDSQVTWSAPKLALSGLITNGRISTIFLADGIDPIAEAELWKHYGYRLRFAKSLLPVDKPQGVLLAKQLSRLMELPIGRDAVLMATTNSGQMNAADVEVAGTCQTLSDAMDDKYIKIPLALAQSLYDFSGADRLCVLLRDRSMTTEVRRHMEAVLAASGIPVETKSWDELSLYYQKVKGYLDVVFLFIFTIVMIIVVMSTTNTMSMAVYERTREVGTLRAIGLKPAGVVKIFALEGGILGLFGSLLGTVLAGMGFLLLRWSNLTYKPPGVSEDVAIEVDLVPRVFLFSFLFFIALSILAAALPAARAARKNIVDALGHV